jgi:hypothetical protein
LYYFAASTADKSAASEVIDDANDHFVDLVPTKKARRSSTLHESNAGMDLARVMEGGDRGIPAPHHEPVPSVPPSFRTYDGARPPSGPSQAAPTPRRLSSSDVWAGAISRLQTQVSLNTSMLESHRRQVHDIEQAVGRLQQEMGNVVTIIREMQLNLQTRQPGAERARQDAGDLEVLAAQVATVSSKANEIDSVKMQLDLMRNRLKRFEDQGSPGTRPRTSSASREMYEGLPASSQYPQHASHHAQQAPPPQPLPPMRTASMASPPGPGHGLSASHTLPSQAMPPMEAVPDPPHQPVDHAASRPPPVPTSGFRPAEPLPPPSALSGWRPADAPRPIIGQPNVQGPLSAASYHSHSMQPEAQSTSWASVNQPIKRPFEERPSPYEHTISAPGSPKKPKLAPIMPRGAYEEAYMTGAASTRQSAISGTLDTGLYSRSRAPSDTTQPPTHALPTPASANIGPYRFVPPSAELEAQAGWHPEAGRMEVLTQPVAASGRGRGGRGRGRGARGRGSRAGAHHAARDSQEFEVGEVERPVYSSNQGSPNGYYDPVQQAHIGPVHIMSATPGVAVDRPDHQEFPATPVSGQPLDPFSSQTDVILNSSSKKSRTKPIRNSDGILIRKDGRPDMRSVSSANNLRKVHAKREAERAEAEGRTPTSARSLAPAHSNSMSEEDIDARSGTPDSPTGDTEERHPQEKHQELMSKLFPPNVEGEPRELPEAYFLRHKEPQPVGEPTMKREEQESVERSTQDDQPRDKSGDVVMREAGDNPAKVDERSPKPTSPQHEDAKAEPSEKQEQDQPAGETTALETTTAEQSNDRA